MEKSSVWCRYSIAVLVSVASGISATQTIASEQAESQSTNSSNVEENINPKIHLPAAVLEGRDHHWADKIIVSGLAEVEFSLGEEFGGARQSDIALATVELGIEAEINPRVKVHVMLLHEDDDTEPMEVDIGTVHLDLVEDGALYLTAGRMYVPFGRFETYLISDPLTLEIGETRESALQIGLKAQGLSAAIYAYNGDTIEAATAEAGKDKVEHFGISIDYVREGDLGFDIGVGYTNSIGDSDLVSAALAESSPPVDDKLILDSMVGAYVAHANVKFGPYSFIGEYLAAGRFKADELNFNEHGAAPGAYHVEGAYNFHWAGRQTTFAISYQSTKEALALGLPQSKYLAGMSVMIFEGTSLGLEVAQGKDYGKTEFGSGDDSTTITVQLAAGF